jgi:hypothetical protein
MVERGLSPVRRVAREAIAAEITERSRAQLSYLAPVVGFPGFARALARTLEDLRLNRITAADLRSTGRSGPDLALLLTAYEEALQEHKFADHAERCVLALGCIDARASCSSACVCAPALSSNSRTRSKRQPLPGWN